ncbi:phage baseplate upper protein [Levilactobacillus brevis]|uniref:phage baseplate upper protein n=1 Tax=Levilactobacillus brevis TaxID=1580 RepID=UPI001C1171EC|nr:phage baseplate upper protein [Levilactobacillus brevis]MBU5275394.1 phage baseplate upper protein [Levilactobacillus brevis]
MSKELYFTDGNNEVKYLDTTASFNLAITQDGSAFDLTNATAIDVKVANDTGYVFTKSIDMATIKQPLAGLITMPVDAEVMNALVPDDYTIEVWVTLSSLITPGSQEGLTDTGSTTDTTTSTTTATTPTTTYNAIFPSDDPQGFTITENVMSDSGDVIPVMSLDEFQQEFDQLKTDLTNKVATLQGPKGDKGDKGDTGTVDNTGLISAPAFQSLQTQVDNSAVGTNLLTGTGSHTVTGTGLYDYGQLFNNDPLTLFKGLGGQTVTVSVDYEYSGFIAGSSNNRIGWEIGLTGDTTVWAGPWYYPNNSSGSGRASSTFVVPKNITSIQEGAGYIQFSGSGTGTLSHFKLEKGSVATDWSPNPTEILTQSDYAKIKAAIVALGGALS